MEIEKTLEHPGVDVRRPKKTKPLRMDIVATKPGAENDAVGNPASFLLIDVTVINLECASHKNISFDKALKAQQDAKRKRYGKWAADNGFALMTFGMSNYGQMDKPTLDFLRSVWDDQVHRRPEDEDESAFKWADFLKPLSRTLAYGNAKCIREGHRLQQFGIDFRRCAWSRFFKATSGHAPTPDQSDQALSPVDTHCPEENDSTVTSDAQPHNPNHLHFSSEAPSPSTDGGDEPQTPNPNHRDDAGASRGPSQMNLQFMSEANTQHQHQHPINNIVGASDPSDNSGGNRVSPRRLVTGNVVEE